MVDKAPLGDELGLSLFPVWSSVASHGTAPSCFSLALAHEVPSVQREQAHQPAHRGRVERLFLHLPGHIPSSPGG